MKKLFALLFFISTLNVFGQEEKKFKLGFALNPCISDNITSNNGKTPVVVNSVLNKIENPIFAYEIAIFSEYNLDLNSKLRFGIGYSNSGYKTNKQKSTVAMPDPVIPEYTQFIYKHRDIVIPVLYTRYLKNKLQNFYFIGGAEPQIKINRTSRLNKWYEDGTYSSDQWNDRSTSFRRINVNFVLGIGYDIKLSEKIRLFVQPTFDCNILGTSTNANINRRIYTYGLSLGTVFK